jgi:hypothetical protein
MRGEEWIKKQTILLLGKLVLQKSSIYVKYRRFFWKTPKHFVEKRFGLRAISPSSTR